MAFDWKNFFRQHNVEFSVAGRNEVAINCPLCSDDPSFHLSISLEGRGWRCFRNAAHRGKSRARLIQAILKCSVEEAKRLAYGELQLTADVDLQSDIRGKLGAQLAIRKPKHLELPQEFKPLLSGGLMTTHALSYLYDRGYKRNQVEWIAEHYNLRRALTGRFAYRIIIPIQNKYGDLMTWTGRTIVSTEEMRYLTLQKEQSLAHPKELLLGLPLLWRCPNPKALLVCEGPFDALWITTFGRAFGVYGTCLFGLSMSEAQASLLGELRERFAYIGLLLDSSAGMQAFRLANSGISLDLLRLPADIKDPAEMSPSRVIELCTSLL